MGKHDIKFNVKKYDTLLEYTFEGDVIQKELWEDEYEETSHPYTVTSSAFERGSVSLSFDLLNTQPNVNINELELSILATLSDQYLLEML